ncbi:uncharacterized protein LOC132088089 [Daphnia carinata]|uniref:uncharacterized protein LOC132088089 n=1 Tax=Daphnia carinata TaxID=120202 RepID=UPI0028686670|nr:uncharacterized protein LOC132088089 [Daphnia carinata]
MTYQLILTSVFIVLVERAAWEMSENQIRLFDEERDGPNAGKFVCLLTKSNGDVPPFMQAIVPGVRGRGYDFSAPSTQGGFASRDMRRFGDKPGFAALPTEVEESWH